MTDSAEVNREIAKDICKVLSTWVVSTSYIEQFQESIILALESKDLAYKKLVEAAKELLDANDSWSRQRVEAALAEIEKPDVKKV